VQGHHDLALDASLRISDPAVFAFINKFHLYDAAARDTARLMNVNEDQAVDLLVTNYEAVSSAVVGRELLRMQRLAEEQQGEGEAQVWRRRMFKYLHALFVKERRATHDFHDLQVLCRCQRTHFAAPTPLYVLTMHLDSAPTASRRMLTL
jgi:hypothetical protein